MCYAVRMANPAKSGERATYRTVVLLRRSEKLKLERLAAKQNISSAEVLRRFIRHGDSAFQNKEEEEMIEATLKMISAAFLEVNQSMAHTFQRLDHLHAELAKRNTP